MNDEKEDMNEKEETVSNLPKNNDRIQVLSIIGQIEGHSTLPAQTKSTKYEQVLPLLISFETDPNIEGVIVILNTIGGDVEAGLAIAEMIKSLSKPTVSLVIGGGHSIGVPLATSTNYSFISPTATMIIHPIRMNGLIIGVPQTFEYFDKMQERIIDFITSTSKITKEELKKLIVKTDDLLNDMGTILIGKSAVDCGIIDAVGGISDALNKLNELISQKKS